MYNVKGINITEIELPCGVSIPLSNGNVYITGKNRTPLSVILFFFVTWPACFITGSKAELPAGYEITAEVARPVIFNVNDGHLVSGKVSESTIENQNSLKQEIVRIKTQNGQIIKAIIQSTDDLYYYYKLQSKPYGKTKRIKKSNVKEVIPIT